LFRLLIVLLVSLVVFLQYRMWVGEGSFAEVAALKEQIAEQKNELARLNERNRRLRAEVEDLRSGLASIEERARSELGMIKDGEEFFQIIEPAEASR